MIFTCNVLVHALWAKVMILLYNNYLHPKGGRHSTKGGGGGRLPSRLPPLNEALFVVCHAPLTIVGNYGLWTMRHIAIADVHR